jgi:hypothetical protein
MFMQLINRRKKISQQGKLPPHYRGQSLAEAALAFPVLLIAMMGLITMGMVGFASVNASNASNYGARMGSVAVTNQTTVAQTSALQKLGAAPVGSYVVSVIGGGTPGTLITVTVTYTVPNYFHGLGNLIGASSPPKFSGSSTAYFRQEGW